MATIFKPPCDEGVIRSGCASAPCAAGVGPWVLAATILGSSMAFIDGTVVNVALPVLQRELNATVADVQWIVEAYALFLAALILLGGSLGDHLGRRRVFAAGVALVVLASIGCGLAQSTGQLIAARALQGIGGALLVPGSLAIISASFLGDARARDRHLVRLHGDHHSTRTSHRRLAGRTRLVARGLLPERPARRRGAGPHVLARARES